MGRQGHRTEAADPDSFAVTVHLGKPPNIRNVRDDRVQSVSNDCVAADMSRRKLNELRFTYRELTFAATD